MENRIVSEIFNETPSTWGLRGDPLFWDGLKNHFMEFSLPYSQSAFIDEVNRYFEKVTGEKLSKDCQVHIPKYSQGGMSGGIVSGAYWIEHAIPLLLERLERTNSNTQNISVFCYEKQAHTSGIALVVVSSLILLVIGFALAFNYSAAFVLILALYLIIYFPILTIGIEQLRLHGGCIQIYESCIEYKRGRKTRLISFREIENITFPRLLFPSIKLHTRQDSIRISKKIQDYQKLYRILAANIPQLNVITKDPVILRESFISTYGTAAFVALLFCTLIYFSVSGYTQGSTPLFMALIMGGLCVFFVVFIIASVLTRPYQFRLDDGGVTECAVLKSKHHPKNLIQTIQYGQIRALHHTRLKHYRMVSYIEFGFIDQSTLLIDDRFINDPIELAVRYAEKVFGIVPEYHNIEKL